MADRNLTAHFSLGELDGLSAPAYVQTALHDTARLLEQVRAELGNVPLEAVSGYRTPAHNRAVGGSPTSQHLDGTAADFTPRGVSLFAAYGKLDAAIRAGRLVVGQLILYPADGHLHVSRPTRGKRNEVLVSFGREDYRPLTTELLAGLPGAPAGAGGVLAVLAGLGLIGAILAEKRQ